MKNTNTKQWFHKNKMKQKKKKKKSVFLLALSADISQCIKNIQRLSEWAEQDSLELKNISNLEAVAQMPFDTG